MTTAEKIAAYLKEKGPQFGPDLCRALGIATNNIGVLTKTAIDKGLLIVGRAQYPDTNRMVNLYSVPEHEAAFRLAPGDPSRFNPADPFGLTATKKAPVIRSGPPQEFNCVSNERPDFIAQSTVGFTAPKEAPVVLPDSPADSELASNEANDVISEPTVGHFPLGHKLNPQPPAEEKEDGTELSKSQLLELLNSAQDHAAWAQGQLNEKMGQVEDLQAELDALQKRFDDQTALDVDCRPECSGTYQAMEIDAIKKQYEAKAIANRNRLVALGVSLIQAASVEA